MVQSNSVAVTIEPTQGTGTGGGLQAHPKLYVLISGQEETSASVEVASDIEFVGSGYSQNGKVTLYNSLGGSSTLTANYFGSIDTGSFPADSITNVAGSVNFWAVDAATGQISDTVAIQFYVSPTQAYAVLTGTVTEAPFGYAVQGAEITLTSSTNSFKTSTDNGGNYSIKVPADTYTVTASAFGYISRSVAGFALAPDSVSQQNFILAGL